MRYTKNSLQSIQKLFREQGYTVRYEKGNFQYGYCLVHERKVIIINKFFSNESRFECLMDVLSRIDIKEGLFSMNSSDAYEQFKRSMQLSSQVTK